MTILSYLFLVTLLGFAIGMAAGAMTPRHQFGYAAKKTPLRPMRQNYYIRR